MMKDLIKELIGDYNGDTFYVVTTKDDLLFINFSTLHLEPNSVYELKKVESKQ